MTDASSKPPIARPVPAPGTAATSRTVRVPTPPTPQPHDDTTPLQVFIPDHTYFPCVHCGKMNRCPPTAVEHARALERLTPIQNPIRSSLTPAKGLAQRIAANDPDQAGVPAPRPIAPELDPGSPSREQDPTRIMSHFDPPLP